VNFRVSLENPTEIMNFMIFIFGSIIIALFSSSAHEEVDRLEESNAQLQTLYRMNRVALQKHTRQRLLEALHLEIKSILKTEVIFYLPLAATPQSLGYSYPPNVKLTDTENTALKVAWEEARVTGFGSMLFADSSYRFKPLVGSMDVVGVMAVKCTDTMKLDPPTIQMFHAIADLTALTMERVELTQLMEESRVREEREKLRSMLLSSVSHDLKTPLASVIGGLSVIRSMGPNLPAEHRDTLIETALEEAQRLDSFITNILDMTRLESGYIQFKKSWGLPYDMASNVRSRLRERLQHYTVDIDANALKSTEVYADIMMSEQVLQNVMDNAAKYTPRGTHITISGKPEGNAFTMTIRDNGPGIPVDKLDKIFDKYERLQHQDSKVAGTGLGLAISKMIMWAQGGTITAGNHPDGGALFTLTFNETRPVQVSVQSGDDDRPTDERRAS
jgi:two-component system, OmpR family, sensor histidine kinase KdpD